MSLAMRLMDDDDFEPVSRQELGKVIDGIDRFGDHAKHIRYIAERKQEIDARAAEKIRLTDGSLEPLRSLREFGRQPRSAEAVQQIADELAAALVRMKESIDITVEMIEDLVTGSDIPGVSDDIMRQRLLLSIRERMLIYNYAADELYRLAVLRDDMDPDGRFAPLPAGAEPTVRASKILSLAQRDQITSRLAEPNKVAAEAMKRRAERLRLL